MQKMLLAIGIVVLVLFWLIGSTVVGAITAMQTGETILVVKFGEQIMVPILCKPDGLYQDRFVEHGARPRYEPVHIGSLLLAQKNGELVLLYCE